MRYSRKGVVVLEGLDMDIPSVTLRLGLRKLIRVFQVLPESPSGRMGLIGRVLRAPLINSNMLEVSSLQTFSAWQDVEYSVALIRRFKTTFRPRSARVGLRLLAYHPGREYIDRDGFCFLQIDVARFHGANLWPCLVVPCSRM